MSHLCTYEEPAWAAYETGSNADNNLSSSATNSPAPRSPFTFKPTATATAQIQQHQQHELQLQQQQFQHNLQLQQQYQQNLQNQIAAKYGTNGKPLTGAASHAANATSNLGFPPGYAPERAAIPPQYYGQPWNSNVQLPPIANQGYGQQNLQSELDYLKNRIVQIEGYMGGAEANGQLPQQYPPQQHPQQLQQGPYPHPQAQPPHPSNQYYPPQQYPNQQPAPTTTTSNNGIQLPSINQIKPFFDPVKGDQKQDSKASTENPTERKLSQNEANIDPTLIDESEVINSFKVNHKHAHYLHLETNGTFETNSFAKKDPFQTNLFLLLQNHDAKIRNEGGENGPLRKRIKLNDHFHNLLQNPRYQVETFFKYETANLTEIIKKINKLLPYKKIVWLLVEKFFTSFADPFIPILEEKVFLIDITKIIGEKELNDSKIKINVDVNNSKDLVDLIYLMLILRISTLSLVNTIKLDKFNNFLLKNAPTSADFDSLIQVLMIYLENFSIDSITRMKLKLLQSFVFNKTTEVSSVSDFYSAGLAVNLNLNNISEIGSNEQLIKVWYHLYFQHYHTSVVKGLPIFLNDEFFNLELSNFTNGNLGINFHKSILEFYEKQIELSRIIFDLWQRLYSSPNQEITVGALEHSIGVFDNFVTSNFKDYDTYKKDITSNYSNKCLNLINNANHKLTKLNLNCYIIIHYETLEHKDKNRYMKVLKTAYDVSIESIEKSFDVFKNYNSHFNAGYEFIVFPSLIALVEKAVKIFMALEVRLWWINKPSLAMLKFFVNMVEELQGFTFMDNYFQCWKLKMKTLLFVNLAKDAYLKKDGAMPLCAKSIKLVDSEEEVNFEDLYTNFAEFTEEEFKETEKMIDGLNSKFENKYADITTLDEFFEKLDIEAPPFDARYFCN